MLISLEESESSESVDPGLEVTPPMSMSWSNIGIGRLPPSSVACLFPLFDFGMGLLNLRIAVHIRFIAIRLFHGSQQAAAAELVAFFDGAFTL